MGNWVKPPLGIQLNVGHPLARGLVGLWIMNEGGGSRVFDLSGNSNTGVITDAVWVGDGLDFAGGASTDVITLNKGVALHTTDVFSLVAIVTPSAIGTLLGILEGASGSVAWVIDTDGRHMMAKDGVAWITPVGGSALQAGETYMLAATYDIGQTTEAFYYVNGALDSYSAVSADFSDSTSRIGDYNGANFDGLISHIAMYDRVLSASEILQLYLKPYAMFKRVPIELWTAATSITAGGIVVLRRRRECA